MKHKKPTMMLDLLKQCKYMGTKRYTQEEALGKFSEKGWKLLGEYISAGDPVVCECPKGHTQSKRLSDISRYGCAICENKAKYTQEQVEDYFNKKGWKVKGQYINTDTRLECTCPKGHSQRKSFYAFRKSSNCTVCIGLAKPTIDHIRKSFAAVGYKLLSTDYMNNHTKLEYECNKGHSHSITWDSFNNGGRRCPYCSNNNLKYSYEFVKDMLFYHDYMLLDKEYKNSKSKLSCICPNDYNINITFKEFLKGTRCGAKLGEKCDNCKNYSLNWKGGVVKKNIPLYTTYAPQLEKYQPVHKIIQDGLELLGVECTFCNKVFLPTLNAVERRIVALNKSMGKENNLYCSEECKIACPTFHRMKYRKGENPNYYDRSDQKQWADLVKERDNYTCQKCGTSEGQMIAHHIDPVINNPIESMDLDNGITLCETCDRLVHQTPGCTYNELRCKS